MAKGTKGSKVEPSMMEAVYESQDPTEQFKSLYGEWIEYQGKVLHPTTGLEVSKHELRQQELTDIVNREIDELKGKIKKDDALNVKKVQKAIFELAKKTYIEQQGIKEESSIDKDILNQNVKNFIRSIAAEVTEDPNITYERAMATIMSARDPIYGRGDERSKILDALLQQYAHLAHKSEYEPTKGHTARRLSYIESRLKDPYLRDEWLDRHGKVLREFGYKADFGPNAQPAHIMTHTADLLGIGETNIKQPYIKATLPAKREKAEYKKAA